MVAPAIVAGLMTALRGAPAVLGRGAAAVAKNPSVVKASTGLGNAVTSAEKIGSDVMGNQTIKDIVAHPAAQAVGKTMAHPVAGQAIGSMVSPLAGRIGTKIADKIMPETATPELGGQIIHSKKDLNKINTKNYTKPVFQDRFERNSKGEIVETAGLLPMIGGALMGPVGGAIGSVVENPEAPAHAAAGGMLGGAVGQGVGTAVTPMAVQGAQNAGNFISGMQAPVQAGLEGVEKYVGGLAPTPGAGVVQGATEKTLTPSPTAGGTQIAQYSPESTAEQSNSMFGPNGKLDPVTGRPRADTSTTSTAVTQPDTSAAPASSQSLGKFSDAYNQHMNVGQENFNKLADDVGGAFGTSGAPIVSDTLKTIGSAGRGLGDVLKGSGEMVTKALEGGTRGLLDSAQGAVNEFGIAAPVVAPAKLPWDAGTRSLQGAFTPNAVSTTSVNPSAASSTYSGGTGGVQPSGVTPTASGVQTGGVKTNTTAAPKSQTPTAPAESLGSAVGRGFKGAGEFVGKWGGKLAEGVTTPAMTGIGSEIGGNTLAKEGKKTATTGLPSISDSYEDNDEDILERFLARN